MKALKFQKTKTDAFPQEVATVSWNKQAVTVTANAALSPDGRMNATEVAETTANAYHFIQRVAGVMDNATQVWLITLIIKPRGTTQWIYLDLASNSAATFTIFNIVTGAVHSNGANIRNSRIKALNNGWFEVIVEIIPPNTNNQETYTIIPLATSVLATHAGSTANGFLLWKSECTQGILHDNVSPDNGVTYLVNESFEATNPFVPYSVEATTGGVTRSTTRATHGVASMRSVINEADAGWNGGPKRAEVNSSIDEFEFGVDYWVGFNTYLENWATDPAAESIWQWHNVPNFGAGETWGTLKLQTPFSLQITNNVMEVVHSYMIPGQETNPNGQVQVVRTAIGAPANNAWTGWVIHCRFHHTDGHIQVWKDDVLVYEKTGHTYYNDETGPYHKIGVYKWSWDIPEAGSTTTTRVAHYDNWRIAEGPDVVYADVDPS